MLRRTKIDTRALGLEIASNLVRFVTGRENLHYGYWRVGVEVCAANLRQAQEEYTEKVRNCFPEGKLKILDIGGGCGEFAKSLVADGHEVEILVPSQSFAARCRANVGPSVPVHNMRFEDFLSKPRFDLCLFSESFQYIPLEISLKKAKSCLVSTGQIVISDCFRTDDFYKDLGEAGIVGGGHSLRQFHEVLLKSNFHTLHEEDITEAVAPSVELEQNLYNMLGQSVNRIDNEMKEVHPFKWKLFNRVLRLVFSKRRLMRLDQRLFNDQRNSEQFCRYNRYKVIKLKPSDTS